MAHRTTNKTLRSFGSYIIRKRQAVNMTADEVAKKIGVSRSTVSRVENGTREVRLEILLRFQKCFDIADDIAHYLRTGFFQENAEKREHA